MASKKLDPKDNFHLYCNLGGDPEEHTSPAKRGTAKVYDPILDDAVEKEFDYPEVNFLTYSVCTGGYDDKPLRWHSCVDWEGVAFRARKGDGLRLLGQFQIRTYLDKDTGEPKTIRQFVVADCTIVHWKVREQAA
jgi:single-stranded DNA-binding protein